MELKRIQTLIDVVYAEGFRELETPLYKVAAGAVIGNPYAGRYVEELDELIGAGAELGKLLGEMAVAQLYGKPHSYGKAAIVGMNGELEHAAALMHPRLGAPLRDAVNGGTAIIPLGQENGRSRHGD